MSDFPISEIDTTKRKLTVGMGASLLGLHAQSQTSQLAEPLSFAKPAPFTSQEFWQKLLDLADRKKGNPTKEVIESAIGTKFIRVVGVEDFRAYFIDYGIHWYFNVSLLDDSKRPSLSISAVHPQVLGFSDGSLKYTPAIFNDLIGSGWMPAPSLAHFVPNYHRFQTDLSFIAIGELNNNVTHFRITWRI